MILPVRKETVFDRESAAAKKPDWAMPIDIATADAIRKAGELREHVDGIRPFDGVLLCHEDEVHCFDVDWPEDEESDANLAGRFYCMYTTPDDFSTISRSEALEKAKYDTYVSIGDVPSIHLVTSVGIPESAVAPPALQSAWQRLLPTAHLSGARATRPPTIKSSRLSRSTRWSGGAWPAEPMLSLVHSPHDRFRRRAQVGQRPCCGSAVLPLAPSSTCLFFFSLPAVFTLCCRSGGTVISSQYTCSTMEVVS